MFRRQIRLDLMDDLRCLTRELSFDVTAEANDRPGYHPATMLKLCL
jgi:hypothetical protein